MYGIGKIFDTKYGGLIFSLLAGAGYFIIILDFILKHTSTGGALLGFFFSPAIIAGAALVIIKTVRSFREEEAFKKINMFLYLQLAIIILSIFFLADILK